MMYWGQMMFQEGGSPFMRQLDYFHDYMMFLSLIILTLVLYGMAFLMYPRSSFRLYNDSHITELIWTMFPLFVLFFLAFPSLRLLYLLEEDKNPVLNLKVVGHQWYWSYSYYDFFGLEFESYMLPEDQMEIGQYRLLEVDSRLVLPSSSEIGLVVTGADVIHSWAVPALGVKMDGIPGRSNSSTFNSGVCGIYYGQCSEICGANHSFMPIVLESVPEDHFTKWVSLIVE